MAKAAVLLPRQEMQQMAADLIAQYPNLSPFCIEYTYTDAACQRAIRLQNDGCELILARGLQAAHRQAHILHQVVLDGRRALQSQTLLQLLLRLGRHRGCVTRALQLALR